MQHSISPMQNPDKRLNVRCTGTEKTQHAEVCEAFEYRCNKGYFSCTSQNLI